MAYVEAIAAAAGYNWTVFVLDRNKVDIGFEHNTSRNFRPDLCRLRVQVKCTYASRPQPDGYIHFPLDSETYEDIRLSGEPHILVVVLVPHEMNGCLEFSPGSMLLRERAYWLSLRDKDPINPAMQGQITIRIPVANEFTVDVLHTLMSDIAEGKRP